MLDIIKKPDSEASLLSRFNDAVDAYRLFPDKRNKDYLFDCCLDVERIIKPVPSHIRTDVADILEDAQAAAEWEKKGATYSGAARRIISKFVDEGYLDDD